MFLPRSGFGRRTAGQLYRIHDCLVLETSEMLVIDYPTTNKQQQQQQKSNISTLTELSTRESHLFKRNDDYSDLMINNLNINENTHQLQEQQLPPLPLDTSVNTVNTSLNLNDLDDISINTNHHHHHQNNNNQNNLTNSMVSHSSTTSSTQQNGQSSSIGSNNINTNGDDVSVSSEQSIQVKDLVRECLEKDPKERNDEDIDILFEFMQHFPVSIFYYTYYYYLARHT